jgi:hypothetical protein
MTRMKLTTSPYTGAVKIVYLDLFYGTPVQRERTFSTTSRDGLGSVIECIDGPHDYPQVCERLAHGGSTLISTRDGLADTIRREYRRMRAADKRRMEA